MSYKQILLLNRVAYIVHDVVEDIILFIA